MGTSEKSSPCSVSVRRTIIAVGIVITFLVSGLAVSASASTSQENFLPDASSDNEMNRNSPLLASAIDSTGHGQLAISAMVSHTSGTGPYDIFVSTSVNANTFGKAGYSCWDPISSSNSWIPTAGQATLAHDEGIIVEFAKYGAGTYPYYGQEYDRIFISSNGFLLFGQPSIGGDGTRTTDTIWTAPSRALSIPDSRVPNGVVAPYWADFNAGVTVKWGPISIREGCFAIVWNNAVTAFSGATQKFGVFLMPHGYIRGEDDGWIEFMYWQIKLETKETKWGSYLQYTMGLENQMGTKGTDLVFLGINNKIGPKNTVVTNKRVSMPPFGFDGYLHNDNRWRITEVKVMAQKYDDTSGNDGSAEVFVIGENSLGMYAGMNVILKDGAGTLPTQDFNDLKHKVLANQIEACVESVHPVFGWFGQIMDTVILVKQFKYADYSGCQDASVGNGFDRAIAYNYACDSVAAVNWYRQTSDLWVAPVFQWHLLGGTSDVRAKAHYLSVWTTVKLMDDLGHTVTSLLSTQPLVFKYDKGLVQVSYDDMNDGAIWSRDVTKSGASIVELTPARDSPVYAEDFSRASLSDWTLTGSYGGYVRIDGTVGAVSTPSLRMEYKPLLGVPSSAERAIPQCSIAARHIEVSVSLRVGDTCPQPCLFQLRQGAAPLTCIRFYNGNLEYLGKDSNGNIQATTLIAGFKTSTWYSFLLEVYYGTGNYSIAVSGGGVSARANDAKYYSGGAPYYIDRVYFSAGPLTGSAKAHPDLWVDDIKIYTDESLHIKYTGLDQANMRIPMSQLTWPNHYSIAMNVYIDNLWDTSGVLVVDDTLVRLINQNVGGLSKLCYKSSSGPVAFADLAIKTWHRIVINVHPDIPGYYVTVDDPLTSGSYLGYGPFPFVGSTPPSVNRKLSVGGINGFEPGSASKIGDAYWDDIRIGQTAEAPTNQPPSASFTATPTGLTVNVDGSGSKDPDGTIVSYAWLWGDATSTGPSSSPTATHTYSSAGQYTIRLTVTDNGGATGTTTRDVIVSNIDYPPTAPGQPTWTAGDEIDGVFALTWTASTDTDTTPVARYWLQEAIGSGSWTTVSDQIPGTSYGLTYRSPATYKYRVCAIDTAGLTGPWSATSASCIVPWDTRLTSNAGTSSAPAIAVDNGGNYHIAWVDNSNDNNNEIYYKEVDPNWNTVAEQRISTNSGDSISPSIAYYSGRRAYYVVVAWADNRNGQYEIFTRTCGRGIWGAETLLASVAGADCKEPCVTADPASANFHYVYRTVAVSGGIVTEKVMYTGPLGTNVVISPVYTDTYYPSATHNLLESPRIAVDSTGIAHVVFGKGVQYPAEHGTSYVYYTRYVSSAWQPVVALGTTVDEPHPCAIDTDSSGGVYVVWDNWGSSGSFDVCFRKSSDSGATWGGTVVFGTAGGHQSKPDITVDDYGDACIVWRDSAYAGDTNYEISCVKSTDYGSTWSSTMRMTNSAGQSFAPRVAMDFYGMVGIAFQDSRDAGNWEIYFTGKYL